MQNHVPEVVSHGPADVRFGSLADIGVCPDHVRFIPGSGHPTSPLQSHGKRPSQCREQSWCVGTALILRAGNSRADVRPAPLPAKLVTFLSVSA